MRTVIGFLMVGVVFAQLSTAQAATEIFRSSTNNTFLNAVSNDSGTGNTTSVGVVRVLGEPGGPQYQLFYLITNFETGLFLFGAGLLDAQDFQVNAQRGSLFVDVNTLTLDTQIGEVPENGIIDVEWEGTGVQRQSGSVFLQGDFVLGVAAGTNVTNPAEVTGSVFGTPLVDPTGDIRILHEGIITLTRQ